MNEKFERVCVCKKKWERRRKKIKKMELLRGILKLGDNEILIWFLID